MRIIRGIKIGGLQQRIFTLVLFFIAALIVIYTVAAVRMQKNLSATVGEAGAEQQASITAVSEQTMEAVLNSSMAQTTALQAYIADDLFADVRTDVLTLQAFATELFAHGDIFDAHPFYEPDASKDGVASVQVQVAEGVDPAKSKDLALVANMSEVMLAMFQNSDKLSSCFVALPDGCILYVDDRSGSYFEEDGTVVHFDSRERPWYLRAVEEGELIFTGVELDAFTDIAGLVCAAPVYQNGKLAAVVGADIFLTAVSDYVESKASEGSFVCVVSDHGQMLFSPAQEGVFKVGLSSEAPDLRKSENRALADLVERALRENTAVELIQVDGKDRYICGAPLPIVGWAVLSVVEKALTDEPTVAMLASYDEINSIAQTSFRHDAKQSIRRVIILTAVVLVLACSAALILASRIVKPIERMTKRVNSLSEEDSVFQMEDVYRTGDEIEFLADSFASISRRTKDYIAQITAITAEKERIGTELELATRIQADMLPNIYPAFPERNEFDIYATMDPAKEVGGDFYDFFLIDEDHLCMVIADVSGKGVPAALFMMASKIILANNAMMGKSPAQILTDTNAAICSNNREEMFVTVWLGILELSSGKLTAANAGHEYPALKQPGGPFELYKDKHDFVIGGFEDTVYRQYELTLEPGAKLFVYTDGVAEAMDGGREQFGTGRMLETLNASLGASPENTLKNIREAVNRFVGDAEQFDDLTMLCLEYNGCSAPEETAEERPS